ncbi:MAG: deoxyguanosinetriphosphate triphosphohydrolase [Ottowia sp.]
MTAPSPAPRPFSLEPPLAPWASHPQNSRGRRHPQPAAPTRNEYQRDRDRIVHSSAFRRLVYKTQVFVNHEGDMFRTRLTHSLEVAQLARAIARALGLHEDLTEAIALAHDLGHTPFGHVGQEALNDCMSEHGGFEHNLQSLRVVDELEQRYPEYDGLNLCYETREGILKHCSAANARRIEQSEPGGIARRFLEGTQPALEAQLCNLADEIAYSAHDIDDGVRSGLLTLEQVAAQPLVARFHAQALAAHPRLQGRRLLSETIRLMLSQQVYDVIAHTRAAIENAGCTSADHARSQTAPLVRFGPEMREQTIALKRFLHASLYRHPQVERTMQAARQIIRELYSAYRADPAQLPAHYARRPDRPRACADFIAGMTDRYALREHERLTGQRLLP